MSFSFSALSDLAIKRLSDCGPRFFAVQSLNHPITQSEIHT